MTNTYIVRAYLNGEVVDEITLDSSHLLEFIEENTPFVSMYKVYVVDAITYDDDWYSELEQGVDEQ